MLGNVNRRPRIFANALKAFCLVVVLVLSASAELESGNIVGFHTIDAHNGKCLIPVIRQPYETEAKYSSFVGQLDEGDLILASTPEEKQQRFAKVEIDDDGEKHAVLDGMIVDNLALPDQTTATVYRVSEKPSAVIVSGEFRPPSYDFDARRVDATLDQIQLPMKIVRRLQTGTGPLQFTLVKKDGTSQPAVVSPTTRKYTNPKTHEAIKDPLDELKGIEPLETSSPQEKETVCALAKETDNSIRDLAVKQFRGVLAMTVFDTDHWAISILVWFFALGVLTLVTKGWDAIWTLLFGLVKRLFQRRKNGKREKRSRGLRHRR